MAQPDAILTVLDPGLATRVVDLGRPGYRAYGLSPGGAADRRGLVLGNALVGNDANDAALEVTLAGFTLEASQTVACVLAGAPFDLHADARSLWPGRTFNLYPGETLVIGRPAWGLRGYLCFKGGLLPPPVLGSRTAFDLLRAGDQLPCHSGVCGGRFPRLPDDDDPYLGHLTGRTGGPVVLRALDGPQADWFPADAFFDRASVLVTPASDRMGLRLQGPPLPYPARNMLSEPVCPGTVQVTPDGQCILLGVDCQTIGGYPKVAQVISADLDLAGQLRPGDRVAFRRVDLAQARQAAAAARARLRSWVARLREAEAFPPAGGPPAD